ncbi:uncharacterized protein METZ01_LOCUS489998, partial [marine metagenome]
MELGLADEDPAVRIGGRTEFELKGEVLGEFLGCPELLDTPAFRRGRDHEPSI